MNIFSTFTKISYLLSCFILIVCIDLTAQSLPNQKLKTSLNAYSFHRALSKDSMKIDDLLWFCAQENFDGIDLTGYYFESYPLPPEDDEIFRIKRLAFSYGLNFSGTGIRTDFTSTKIEARKANIQLVQNWIEVAAKLGAPVLRIFIGPTIDDERQKTALFPQIIEDLKTCVQYAAQYGIILGIQNHNEFLKTATEVEKIFHAIPSPWLGLVLDIGSFRLGNPYEQIKRMIPYTVNWQLKEKMYENEIEVTTDINRIITLIKQSNYSGYIPIETLGPGNAQKKVKNLMTKVQNAINSH